MKSTPEGFRSLHAFSGILIDIALDSVANLQTVDSFSPPFSRHVERGGIHLSLYDTS